jgi:hypothetical protein
MTPSVNNNVKEVMTNAVATYPIFAKPYKNHYERYLHPGDLIFVYTSDSAGTAGIDRRGKPCIVANLPLLNHFLSLEPARGGTAHTEEGLPKGFTDAKKLGMARCHAERHASIRRCPRRGQDLPQATVPAIDQY